MHRPVDSSISATVNASLLTPPGRGAVAVIRVHAPGPAESDQAAIAVDTAFVAANGKPLTQQPVGRLCYGHWVTDHSSEDVVVCRTDESTVEVSCHGGRAAVRRIFDSLKAAGATIVDWQTQQAVMTSPFESELADAVTRATTGRAAAILVDQASGVLESFLERIQQLNASALATQLGDLLSRSRFGLHLTQPWRVVLAGRPNVGKSTLINALLGYTRAIVFDQPGTTRDVVTGQTAFDGWPFQLADTAGIRDTTDELELVGIERARRTAESADLVCLLLDLSQPLTVEDHALLAEFTTLKQKNSAAVIVVAHKSDLPSQRISAIPEDALPVSSTTGDGVEELITHIVQTLVPTVPPPGTPVPVSRRQIQWLTIAQQAAAAGDTPAAVSAIENVRSGVPFDD
ncbi:MAG: 50S ribosome-binding GTPase [Rhodopirellula sp.]|nr:50S ribosome-binding GTPase [Rhodopirellula sp.]